MRYVYSDNNGASWSSQVDLNPQVKNASWRSLFASSGHGIQLASGRLIQPLVYRDGSGNHAANIYSDDHGATWHTGGAAGTGVNESKAIQRGNSNVVQNMRPDSAGFRRYATSTNGAQTFGSASVSTLVDPGCNADEISYLRPTDVNASTHAPLTTATALFSNNKNSSSRINLTVRLSSDNGATWPYAALIAPGTAGYSTLAVLNDGTVGDLYEVGSSSIVFSRFTLAWAQAA